MSGHIPTLEAQVKKQEEKLKEAEDELKVLKTAPMDFPRGSEAWQRQVTALEEKTTVLAGSLEGRRKALEDALASAGPEPVVPANIYYTVKWARTTKTMTLDGNASLSEVRTQLCTLYPDLFQDIFTIHAEIPPLKTAQRKITTEEDLERVVRSAWNGIDAILFLTLVLDKDVQGFSDFDNKAGYGYLLGDRGYTPKNVPLDPKLAVIDETQPLPPAWSSYFTGNNAPTVKDLLDRLATDICLRRVSFNFNLNHPESTKREFVGTILHNICIICMVLANITSGLELVTEIWVRGSKGQGPFDYAFRLWECHWVTVVEAKAETLSPFVGQAMAQLAAARENTASVLGKRKRDPMLLSSISSTSVLTNGQAWTMYTFKPEGFRATSEGTPLASPVVERTTLPSLELDVGTVQDLSSVRGALVKIVGVLVNVLTTQIAKLPSESS